MNSNEDPCRICLTTNVFFDWSEAVFEFSGPSYKECYYQYTHLQEQDSRTQMLCLDCGNGLRNAYILVEKALASDLKLKSQKCVINADKLLQSEKVEVISEDMYNSFNSEKALTSDLKLKNQQSQIITDNTLQLNKDQVVIVNLKNLLDTNTTDNLNTNKDEKGHVLTEALAMNKVSDEESRDNDFSLTQNSESASESEIDKNSTANTKSVVKRIKKRILMCAYCSWTFKSRTHLTNHEKTHQQNRERTEVCPICGLKMYCKYGLKAHMAIHDDKRERNYKCEFCPKSFFARGALNVHRRIHLGQMVKCNFCPKEFYRQVDLNRHMKSHDVMPLKADIEVVPKVRVKYFRECDICGDKVNTNSWKRHKAKHLNQYEIECLICNKQFFPDSDIKRHLRQCHDVMGGDSDKFIKKLDTKFEPRLTRLMIEQEVTKVYTEKY
ncbi:zinc finger protein 334-like isoform X2 [Lucilia sericata]|uniref:zinc finger protein 334-like isoform X2 n=1 Tax=Lucilia sericata TaxID=13632 RepID=UPI0018A846F8|nr:zinc finger protein 334-like isoform X2 [Lucilia sericata]